MFAARRPSIFRNEMGGNVRRIAVTAISAALSLIAWNTAFAGAGPDRDAMLEVHAFGANAMKEGDLATARQYWHEASDMGHSDSSYYLARIYDRGLAAKQDFTEAAKYYLRASAQGSIFAEPRLGRLYLNGFGVKKDPAEAQRWFRRAATWLVRPPNYDVDLRLASGSIAYEPVAQEFKDALAWMSEVRSWNAERQYRESVRYRDGDGVSADTTLAQRLLGIAAQGGVARAQHEFGMTLLSGHSKPLLSGEECEAVAEAGLAWLHRAAASGYPEALGDMGAQYADEANSVASDSKAFYWLTRARASGADVDAVLARVVGRITQADRATAQGYLAGGPVPDL